jgi:hypothetical protein
MRGQARRARLCADPGKWLRLDPRASADLAIEGSGILRKLWCVFNADGEPNVAMNALRAHRDLYRNIWIHIAFDDSGSVQVSAPLADFFLLGHGDVGDVDSHYFQAVRIPPLDESPYQGALTCFAPMPFGERVKISFVNGNSIPVRLIASIDWLERTHTASPLYFHASYRHGRCHREPIVVLDKRNVRGSFVGLGLYVTNPDGANWWHEGCESFDIDGHRDAIVGTGAEDYFCLAWGFRRLVSRPLFGVTCLRPSGGSPLLTSGRFNPAGEFAMYRLHVHDPVSFRRSLRLRFTPAVAERVDNGAPLEFRSVAFWYGRDIEPEPGDATGTPPASHV